jgi:hypothetical protein
MQRPARNERARRRGPSRQKARRGWASHQAAVEHPCNHTPTTGAHHDGLAAAETSARAEP